MIRLSHLLVAALLFTASTPTIAASKGGWDGTWAGSWGGKDTESTSVTVEGKRVVSYTYQGASHPVSTSNVTPSKITYEDQGNMVTLAEPAAERECSYSQHSQASGPHRTGTSSYSRLELV
jgi:hypothetical protein